MNIFNIICSFEVDESKIWLYNMLGWIIMRSLEEVAAKRKDTGLYGTTDKKRSTRGGLPPVV